VKQVAMEGREALLTSAVGRPGDEHSRRRRRKEEVYSAREQRSTQSLACRQIFTKVPSCSRGR